jgi:hypothetical protein
MRQIVIKVVLPIETRKQTDSTVQRKGGSQRLPNTFAVQYLSAKE